MFCSQCGTKLPGDAKYCPNCGRSCASDLADASPPPAAARVAEGGPTSPADHRPSDLRLLLSKVWGIYGILEKNTNDVGGITRQLINRMGRSRREYLPEESTVTNLIQAIDACLANPDRTRTRKELEMAAALPDLRARHIYRIEAINEGSGYPYDKDVAGERNCSCAAVRQRAAALISEAGD